VIGAGHNGLVAAARRADAGWDVLLLEAEPAPGGVVTSAELVPGYVSELFSAFYPLSAVSPARPAVELQDTDRGDRARPLRLATSGPPMMRTRR